MQNVTLKAALTTMPLQAIFDIVARHLLTQKKKSKHPLNDVRCVYRAEGGLMCAVGCLISDDEYDEEMEDSGAIVDVVANFYADVDVDGTRYELLSALQSIHDDHTVEEWEHQLAVLARHTGLTFTPTTI